MVNVKEQLDITKVDFSKLSLEELVKVQNQISAQRKSMQEEQQTKFQTAFNKAMEAFKSENYDLTELQRKAVEVITSPQSQGQDTIKAYVKVDGKEHFVAVRRKKKVAKKAKKTQ